MLGTLMTVLAQESPKGSEYQTAIAALVIAITILAAAVRVLYRAGHKCQEEKARIMERHEKVLAELLSKVEEDET